MPISSYATVYAIGHKSIADIFSGPVLIEEKVDGSSMSMSRTNGVLECRSKGAQLFVEAPEKMFTKGIETALNLDLHDGWVYRAEYLKTPKHNALAYSRVPNQNLIVFDIGTGLEEYLDYDAKAIEAARIGLECVPRLYQGTVSDFESLHAFLETESILGGTKIEGFVVKNYSVFTMEKKIAIGKYVSEKFKEVNQKNWKETNPSGKDFIQLLIEKYKTEARWAKAVQHLRDGGKLEGSPRDIGLIIREIPDDILKENDNEIRDELFNHFWPTIKRGITAGVPDWYKETLARSAFPTGGQDESSGPSTPLLSPVLPALQD